jgi:hypothetical protein
LKKDLIAKGDSISKRISAIEAMYMTPEGVKGISDIETRYMDMVWGAFSLINTGSSVPGTNAKNAVAKLEIETNKIVDAINQLMQNDWKQWRADVEKMDKPLFKEVEKL